MGATAANLLTQLRDALMDTDAAAYYWTDTLLNDYVQRAASEYSRASPQLLSTTKNGDGTTRRFDCSAATGLLFVYAVEYPIDEEEPVWLAFQEEAPGTVRVLTAPPAAGTNNVKIWYAAMHTISTSSTIPPDDDPIIILIAAALAQNAAARWSSARLNASGWTPRQLRELADENRARADRLLDQVQLRGPHGHSRMPVWPLQDTERGVGS